MNAKIQKYQYLWDGTAPQWALMSVNRPDGTEGHLVVNTQAKSAKIIEDNEEAEQVIQKMLEAGVRVVTPGKGF